MRGILATAAGLALAGMSSAGAVETVTYHNERFGFSVEAPVGWNPDPPPENGDGVTFRSPDRRAFVSAFGHFVLNSFADEARSLLSEHDGENDTLKRSGKDWAVVSGLREDTIFYRRGVISCGGTVWNEVDIEYPAQKKKDFDALVVKIAGSLKPGIGVDTGPCR